MADEQSIREELAATIHENFNACRGRNGVSPDALAAVILASPVIRRIQAEARSEGIRGAAEAVHAEARWQQEQVMRGAVQKSGAETAVERLLVVETLLRQQAEYFERGETA